METATAPRGRVLIVDDEPGILSAYSRWLSNRGFTVDTVGDAVTAVDRLGSTDFDVVLSDISMPGMDGIELLRQARQNRPDLPFVLMTAGPEVETAIAAVEYRALRYLTKPVELRELEQVLAEGVRERREADARRREETARVHLGRDFDRALDKLWMAYQPIVCWSRRAVYSHEALVRTAEPSLGNPAKLFAAAETLERLPDIGRRIRDRVAADAGLAEGCFFVNLHPRDLADDALFLPDAPLAGIASRIVLEITERAALDEVKGSSSRVAELRKLGFRIAIDDLGAGYAGLASVAELEPDVVKIDMSLIRDIDKKPTQRRLVASIADVCRDLGILLVAEGIETPAERDTVVGLGCDLLQGYLFAPPSRGLPAVKW